MSAHAGFAAVLGIDHQLLNDSLRNAYLNNQIPNRMAFTAGIPDVIEYTFDLFSDAPEVQFTEDFDRDFVVTIRSWGHMQISTAGPQRGVETTIVMRVPHIVTIDEDSNEMVFDIDSDNLVVTTFDVVVLQGDEFSDSILAFHDSNLFLGLVSESVRGQMSDIGNALPRINIKFLDNFLVLPLALSEQSIERLVTTKSLNGLLCIGIDLLQGNYGTVGNPRDFQDINQGLSFAIATDPNVWLPVMETKLVEGDDEAEVIGIRQKINEQNANLESFSMEMGEGYLRIKFTASKEDVADVDASFDMVPNLVRPATYNDLGADERGVPLVIRTPARDELWFSVENVQVNIDQAWWITLVEVLLSVVSYGIPVLVVNAFKNMYQSNIEATLYQENNLQFELGDIEGKIERFEFHPDAMVIGISTTAEYPDPTINPVWEHPNGINHTVIDVDERLLDRELRFAIQLPHTVHVNDPFLRIAWDVRRIDDNASLTTLDGNDPEVSLPSSQTSSDLRIHCRVYRVLWNPPIEIYQGVFTVLFRDRIDQSHPYVRWRHYVGTPDVNVDAEGNRTTEGFHIKLRHSKIHRTDFPNRCRMVSRHSLSVPWKFNPPPSRPPKIIYFDALPFPDQEILHRRDELCDYCFFGGPGSSTIKPLPNSN